MNLKENFNNLLEKGKKLTKEQLKTYKIVSFVAIVIEIIGIYYFLGWKKVGMVLMLITLAVLGAILYLQSKFPAEVQTKKKEDKKMQEEETSEQEEQESGFDFGLPNSEDYNRRMSDAFEFKGF